MFNTNNNLIADDKSPDEEESKVEITNEQDPLSAQDVMEEEQISEDDVHTIPTRFLKSKSLPKKKGRVSWIVLGIVIFVVLGLVIMAAVIFLMKQKGEKSPVVEDPLVNLNLMPPVNENQNENQNENTNQALETAALRDQRRLQDITELRSALELYFNANEFYPNSLSNLTSGYLSIIPENPLPGGEQYTYLTSTDKLNYQLTFVLEEGTSFGNLRLTAGKYETTPQGIFPYSEEPPVNNNTNSGNETPEPIKPTMGLDSDGDLLSDIEENVYKTNSILPDTDGDSYQDAEEVVNLYDPTKAGSARLIDSGLVTAYYNYEYSYSVLYPTSWVVRSLTPNKSEVIFTSSNGEFMEIIIQPNPLGLSALNWYINQNSTIDTSGFTTLLVDGLPAIQTADGLTTYLAVGTNIYTISYNIGVSQQMYFYSTYKLFLRTFSFKYIGPQSDGDGDQEPPGNEGLGEITS
ncbi:hypothetical protein KKF32_02710 [Patescibacteria group bacterium]|nr:hypothetical protein [Patescibacteria group bacterium]